MRILATGGAGYIGSALVPVLQEQGYEVDVVDLLWFGDHLPRGTRVIQKNLFDCQEEDLDGYDQVIFLAGLSNDPMAEFSPALNFVYNAALPSYLAYLAKRAGVRRFIYASTCSVYGYTKGDLYDEDSPVTCSYPYGISKLQGERGVLQLRDKNFSTVGLRQGTVCGPSPRMRFDLIVNTMYKCAIRDGKITINNPSIWRPILDIRDACTAFLCAVQADDSISGVFNVASGNFTVGQVGDMVKEEVEALTARKVALEVKNVADHRNYKVTWDRARTRLSFLAQHSIRDTVKSLHRSREQYADFSRQEYYNIEVFKKTELAAETRWGLPLVQAAEASALTSAGRSGLQYSGTAGN